MGTGAGSAGPATAADLDGRLPEGGGGRHIVIVATRRSGSTAFFRLFRGLPEHAMYDEPFNPLLNKLPRDNPNRTRHEFVSLYEADPNAFRSRFAPIPLSQETIPGMTERQRVYLSWLLSHRPTVIDVTRCHSKIQDLHAVAPDALFVHLYRPPASFVTSHLLPTNGLGNFRLREWWGSRTFFTRPGRFNKWHMEDLLTGAHASNTRRLLEGQGVRPPDRGASAVLHLLAYWLASYRIAERDGRRLYGDHFLSVNFEEFCGDPRPTCDTVLGIVGHDTASLDLSRLRRPRPAHLPEDPRWRTLARDVGFSEEEVARLLG